MGAGEYVYGIAVGIGACPGRGAAGVPQGVPRFSLSRDISALGSAGHLYCGLCNGNSTPICYLADIFKIITGDHASSRGEGT